MPNATAMNNRNECCRMFNRNQFWEGKARFIERIVATTVTELFLS